MDRIGAVVPVANDYSEDKISFTDILTNDVSITKHGYQPKLPNNPTLFMNGFGQYVAIPSGGGTSGSQLISGGGVAWTGTGLNFIISAAVYLINGTQHNSVQTPITLVAANPTLDRIDLFYVDVSGLAGVITGTASVNPVAPSIDPITQLDLTFVYIPASSGIPVITTENVYLENTEWTMSTSSGAININSTINPYAGTKDIEGTNVGNGVFFTAVKPAGSEVLPSSGSVILQIRSKAAWPNQKSISIFWLLGATVVGQSVALRTGTFGFDSSIITGYQQIVIPVANFGTGAGLVDRIRMSVAGGGATIGWYIDNIVLQSGGGGGGGTGSGDFSTNTTISVVDELILFADTTGKLGKRATLTGIPKLTAGVLGLAGPSDFPGAASFANTIFVTKDGNNATGTRERLDLPFLTVPAACAVATAGDVIMVGPGTFVENAGIELPNDVHLQGSGFDVTVITSTLLGTSSPFHGIVAPGNNSVISDLTIQGIDPE